MQSIDTSGIEAFDRTLAELLKEDPDERHELHEKLGAMAKLEVNRAIASSGVNDSHGNVRRFQVRRIGSKGGYAAVSAAGSNDGAMTGSNSPGAITNYLESGHKIRPHKSSKGYRPRICIAYVNGFHFYQSAGTSVEAKAISMVEDFANRLADKLEGGLL